MKGTISTVLVTFLSITFMTALFIWPRDYSSYSDELSDFIDQKLDEVKDSILTREDREETWRKGRITYKKIVTRVHFSDAFDIDGYWEKLKAGLPEEFKVAGEEYKEDKDSSSIATEICYKKLPVYLLRLSKDKNQPPDTSALAEKPMTGESSYKAKIALVIDDIGYNRDYEDILFSLPKSVTLSILPKLPYSEYFAMEAKERGFSSILHLPMEAERGNNPGEGAIYTDMDAEKIRMVLTEDMATVPYAKGVSNHMGSLATADERVMGVILDKLKENDLFFLDSLTTSDTVARRISGNMGVVYLQRDVFLDNKSNPEYIRGQIRELEGIALSRGSAIGIGHYREHTLLVLKEMIPQLEVKGVKVARLNELAE